jgi:peptidoglycan/xylan/chitin deacetylase (PgdA/CDA1 family)
MISDSYILYLHRVGEKNRNKISPNNNMIITPAELENFIISTKDKYKFISIDDLLYNINKNIIPKNVILLTFDDGYLDNYTNAFPILKYYNIPFIIYLNTNYINNNIIPWWYQLEDVIDKTNENIFFDGLKFKSNNRGYKNETFLKIREIAFSSNQKMKYLEKYLVDNFSNHNSNQLFLNWNQIEILNNDNLVTLGAHTHTHANLVTLSQEELKDEILISKRVIEYNIMKQVNHFAYPYGAPSNYSTREINFLVENKFESSVTTKFGFLNKKSLNNKHELPRIMLGSDFFNIRRKLHRLYKLYHEKN